MTPTALFVNNGIIYTKKQKLGRKPKITFEELFSEMVSENLKSTQWDEQIKQHDYQIMHYHE
jgi:GDPmannose 4,6-dehydratase